MAATSIQAAFRGFASRPYSRTVVKLQNIRRVSKLNGERNVEAALLKNLSVDLGLEIIEGVTLQKKNISRKKRVRDKQRKEKEERGAVALQTLVRARAAKFQVAERREIIDQRERSEAAQTLGRVMRGKIGRRQFSEKRKSECATLIQGRFRILASKERTEAMKNERKVKELEGN